MWVREIYKQTKQKWNLPQFSFRDGSRSFREVPDKLLPCIYIHVYCIFYMYGLQLSLFYRYMRMSPESFKYLLNAVGLIVSNEDTRFWKTIPSAERLCLTLHCLAYGGSQQSLSFSFRIPKSTICSIIKETCKAIWDCMSDKCVRPPKTSDNWKRIAKDFENVWNLPHCIGG